MLFRKRGREKGRVPYMVAEQKKAPNSETEPFRSSRFDVSAFAETVEGEAVDRPGGLDLRAQSALLREAFEEPDAPELDAPAAAPPSQRENATARLRWRAFKSVLGLGIVIIAGVGPVQRLLELSSVEAVVNAR